MPRIVTISSCSTYLYASVYLALLLKQILKCVCIERATAWLALVIAWLLARLAFPTRCVNSKMKFFHSLIFIRITENHLLKTLLLQNKNINKYYNWGNKFNKYHTLQTVGFLSSEVILKTFLHSRLLLKSLLKWIITENHMAKRTYCLLTIKHFL